MVGGVSLLPTFWVLGALHQCKRKSGLWEERRHLPLPERPAQWRTQPSRRNPAPVLKRHSGLRRKKEKVLSRQSCSWARWHKPVISLPEGRGQRPDCELRASLGYPARSYLKKVLQKQQHSNWSQLKCSVVLATGHLGNQNLRPRAEWGIRRAWDPEQVKAANPPVNLSQRHFCSQKFSQNRRLGERSTLELRLCPAYLPTRDQECFPVPNKWSLFPFLCSDWKTKSSSVWENIGKWVKYLTKWLVVCNMSHTGRCLLCPSLRVWTFSNDPKASSRTLPKQLGTLHTMCVFWVLILNKPLLDSSSEECFRKQHHLPPLTFYTSVALTHKCMLSQACTQDHKVKLVCGHKPLFPKPMADCFSSYHQLWIHLFAWF